MNGKLKILEGHTNGVRSVTWSPDSTQIASGGPDKGCIWNSQTGELLRTLKTGNFLKHENINNIYSIAWSPDGTRIVAGSDDKKVHICNSITGKSICTLKGTSKYFRMRSVSWSPDSTKIVAGSSDFFMGIWNIHTGKLIFTLKKSRDSLEKYVNYDDKIEKIRNSQISHSQKIEKISALYQFKPIWKNVNSVAWSPSGTQIMSGCGDGKVRIWNRQNGKLLRTMEGHKGEVNSVAWSNDGIWIISGGDDGKVRIWNSKNGASVNYLEGHGKIYSVAWSNDGTRVLWGNSDNDVLIWNIYDKIKNEYIEYLAHFRSIEPGEMIANIQKVHKQSFDFINRRNKEKGKWLLENEIKQYNHTIKQLNSMGLDKVARISSNKRDMINELLYKLNGNIYIEQYEKLRGKVEQLQIKNLYEKIESVLKEMISLTKSQYDIEKIYKKQEEFDKYNTLLAELNNNVKYNRYFLEYRYIEKNYNELVSIYNEKEYKKAFQQIKKIFQEIETFNKKIKDQAEYDQKLSELSQNAKELSRFITDLSEKITKHYENLLSGKKMEDIGSIEIMQAVITAPVLQNINKNQEDIMIFIEKLDEQFNDWNRKEEISEGKKL